MEGGFESAAGREVLEFLGLDIGVGGVAAFSVGRAIALAWRTPFLTVCVSPPITAAIRFLHYALFDEPIFSASGWAVSLFMTAGFAWLGFSLTRRVQMKRLYGPIVRSEPRRAEDAL